MKFFRVKFTKNKFKMEPIFKIRFQVVFATITGSDRNFGRLLHWSPMGFRSTSTESEKNVRGVQYRTLESAGEVAWSNIDNTPVPKLEQLWTWDFWYLLWGLLRSYTQSFTSQTSLIMTKGYFKFLIAWLARKILNERLSGLWIIYWNIRRWTLTKSCRTV